MALERKRVEKVVISKLEPKKREVTKSDNNIDVEKPKVIEKTLSETPPIKKTKVIVKKIAEVILEPVEIIATEPEQKRTRTKQSDDKYIRFSTKNYSESYKLISERISKGEIKWAYYAIDGDEGYHYFLINKH